MPSIGWKFAAGAASSGAPPRGLSGRPSGGVGILFRMGDTLGIADVGLDAGAHAHRLLGVRIELEGLAPCIAVSAYFQPGRGGPQRDEQTPPRPDRHLAGAGSAPSFGAGRLQRGPLGGQQLHLRRAQRPRGGGDHCAYEKDSAVAHDHRLLCHGRLHRGAGHQGADAPELSPSPSQSGELPFGGE